MHTIDPSKYAVSDLQELIGEAENVLRLHEKAVFGIPEWEWPVSKMVAIERTKRTLQLLREELALRAVEVTSDGASSALRDSVALVISNEAQGTAFSVTRSLLVTAAHVVRDVGDGGSVRLRFETGDERRERQGRVVARDEERDVALLRSDELLDCTPNQLQDVELAVNSPWESYGYLYVAGGTRIRLAGTVWEPRTRDTRRCDAVCLYSPQAGAGMGSPLRGLSGSPVFVGGRCIGHLASILGDVDEPNRVAHGLLYAIPAQHAIRLIGEAGQGSNQRSM